MIFDSFENIKKYKGIYSNLDKVLDYLLDNNLKDLKDGKNIVCGEDIYINVVNGKLIEESEGVFEVHEKYLDLHIDIEGSEKILFCDNDQGKIVNEYSPEGDYALLKSIKNSECIIDNNHFAICMTGEPHMPLVKNEEMQNVRKAIFKIKVN